MKTKKGIELTLNVNKLDREGRGCFFAVNFRVGSGMTETIFNRNTVSESQPNCWTYVLNTDVGIAALNRDELLSAISDDDAKRLLTDSGALKFIERLYSASVSLMFLEYLQGVKATDEQAIRIVCEKVLLSDFKSVINGTHELIFGRSLPPDINLPEVLVYYK